MVEQIQVRPARGADLLSQIDELGPWFHNLHFPGGTQTAPDHPLGDFPRFKWKEIAPHLPDDLTGWSVLDIGCNAGFYSFELARRGAEVTAIDVDPHYLRQARWAAGQFGLEDRVTFREMQVYSLAHEDASYDLVWFMGVFYHLRYPLLALDLVARKTRRLMMFQTLTFPDSEEHQPVENLWLSNRNVMGHPGWPKMAFIEHRLRNDPTNWWAANHTCVEAMLRSSGFRIVARPEHEAWLAEPDPHRPDPHDIAELLESEFRAATGLAQRGR